MESLVHTLFSNALAATVLAVVATCLARTCRRPALTHSLWLLVMVKLITPPLVPIALPDAGVAVPARSYQAIADLKALARFWEGEPPGEPRRNPARTEPRPPGITQGRLVLGQ
jgi:hypothetical protein